MRIAVTGATGVIGRRTVPLLLAAGHQVTAVVRREPGRLHALPAEAQTVKASLFDRDQLMAAFTGHEAVINLATHIPSSMFSALFRSAWQENDRIRSVGSRTVANAAAAVGVKTLIQESVGLAYPSSGAEWIDESTALRPPKNAKSVLDAEASVADFAARKGRGVALRFAAFYGPDANQTKIMARSVRMGWAPLPGARNSYISSVSHDDAATAVVASLDAPSGAYNVSDDRPVTREEFFAVIAKTLHVRPPRMLPAWTAKLMGVVGDALIRSTRTSNAKLKSVTNWSPAATSVAEGLPAAIEAAIADEKQV
ncbi:NAD(P)H-binding protein [Mesorhizobium sp. B283B1A]|uniref:NAD-dependent epimerase/dehydratase family protein n=1 Tax=Mesorhizobium TaxID=68287 RepID=UPI001CD13635|nr:MULTISPECIES: NAD-dependent epimerase/dehydratase family protein [Mesorhizobium]MCA0046232.1 NAD(P)H-binding protein [Mesorhizobium sp. B283B1A]UQS62846.1 NAD(P)H-binding protein [Mesorhizobium opportunistum]